MNRKVLTLLAIFLSQTGSAWEDESNSEEEIRNVFSSLTEAWRNADGQAWSRHFVEDADFTVWFGLELKGREAIARGHQYIFDGVYANTAFELEIRQLRFLGENIAVTHLKGYVVGDDQKRPDKPDAVPIAVLERTAAGWRIVAFHNTANIVEEVRESISLKTFREIVSNAESEL